MKLSLATSSFTFTGSEQLNDVSYHFEGMTFAGKLVYFTQTQVDFQLSD